MPFFDTDLLSTYYKYTKYCLILILLKKYKKTYSAWSFCYDKKSADALVNLVKEEKKTATSSLHCLYAIENEPLPKEGQHNIILNHDGIAECIVKTTSVKILPFNKVPKEFASKEGEGDKSLEYWREIHKKFFKKELASIRKEFTEDMLLFCEEFKLVYS